MDKLRQLEQFEGFTATAEKQELAKLDHVVSVFVQSFRYSQGDSDLQLNIYKYLRIKNPDIGVLLLDSSNQEYVFNQAKQSIQKYFGKSTEHVFAGADEIADNFEKERDRFRSTFTSAEELWEGGDYESRLLPSIAKEVLNRDHRFLVRSNGRDKTVGDRYSSDFISFVLRKGSRMMPEYQQMFDDLHNFVVPSLLGRSDKDRTFKSIMYNKQQGNLESPLIEVPIREVLMEVIDAYNRHHPDDQVNLDQILSENN